MQGRTLSFGSSALVSLFSDIANRYSLPCLSFGHPDKHEMERLPPYDGTQALSCFMEV
jgi:hypothetical protein